MSITSSPLTLEQFLALPDDGVERELVDGELREKPITFRNQEHATIVMTLGHKLLAWRQTQAEKPGRVSGGEVGCILRRNPHTVVGIDVAYFSQATLDQQNGESSLIEGAPLLAIEVLSPSDRNIDIGEKVRLYLAAGSALVWVVDPQFRTVTVHRPDANPQFFNEDACITAEPFLPGLTIPVSEIFHQ